MRVAGRGHALEAWPTWRWSLAGQTQQHGRRVLRSRERGAAAEARGGAAARDGHCRARGTETATLHALPEVRNGAEGDLVPRHRTGPLLLLQWHLAGSGRAR